MNDSLKGYVDKINDGLLSQFYFTVKQHSKILQKKQEEEKFESLVEAMYQCEETIYESFRQILESLGINVILQNLEIEKQRSSMKGRKREHISGMFVVVN